VISPKVKRRPASKAKPYHWFQGASVRELYDQIGAIGPDTARVEVRQAGNKMTFDVLDPAAPVEDTQRIQPAINDSKVCPPICP
jgi:hypothetical protein